MYSEGKFDAALPPLETSLKLNAREIKPYLLLGDALSRLGRVGEAAMAWQGALRIDPNSTMALDGLAKALISVHAYDEVITLLNPEPEDENLSLDLGVAYGGANQLDDGVRVLTGALKRYPDSARLVDALVTIYVHQLRYTEAVNVTGELARRRPQDLAVQRIYLRSLILDSNQELSVPLAHKLLQRAPRDGDVLFLCGAAERLAGDFTTARRHLEQAAAINPKHYNTHFNLGAVLAQLHDYAGAEQHLKQAIELGAIEPEVRFELAQALRKQGRIGEADDQLKIYKEQLKERADNTLAAQKSTQAAESAARGDKQQAAVLLGEASDTVPNDAKIAYRWGMILNDIGDLNTERTALERAVHADPRFFDAHYQLGYVYSKLGEPVLAEEQFRLTVGQVPGHISAWISLAASLAMQSKFPQAREAVENAISLDPQNKDAQSLRDSLPVPAQP